MKISLITAAELDPRLQAAWRALQQSNPALLSPCFCPGFTQAVAATRDDVRIAVMEDTGGIRGFFPHQARRGRGEPAGGALSDHHGVVCAPGTLWDWSALLRACGLSYWRFDHLPRAQAPLDRPTEQASSPGLDLRAGFDAWRARRRAAGARHVIELERKARKLAREVGPLRFEPHTTDPRVLETVIELKSRQCRETGVDDFFAQAWARALAQRICQAQDDSFGGRLSALYAGDTLVSAHLGMRSPWVWHWWFPVYARPHAAYSPGGQLLLQVARAAAASAHGLLELGKGEDRYKQSFADCSLPLAEGWVCRPSLAAAWLAARHATRCWLRTSRLVDPLRPLVRQARRMRAGATGT